MSSRLKVLGDRLGWVVPADFIVSFERRLAMDLRKKLLPVSGVREALAQLDGPRCIASNGSHAEIRFRLGLVELLHHFEPHLFSASEVARAKPHPDLFVYAAEKMGSAAARCAVVEDSLAGVQAAVRAGMRVFGYAALTDARVLREAGAVVFDHMSELPELVRFGA
jgi:HAD superfamily hydrolase (TIGR01509 family)